MAIGLGLLLNTVISALVPVGVEGVKKVIENKFGSPTVNPQTVAEKIQLDESEVKRLEAIAKLDQPGGTPSQWVVDLRAASRYVAAFIVLLGGFGLLAWVQLEAAVALIVLDAMGIVFGFLFGSRFLVPRR